MSTRSRVYVGLSGGVDSSVSAALLKERGFDVVGVFIKIWRPEFIECTWKQDRLDAMRICAALAIPYREIDLSLEYKKDVVDPMLQAYAAGITPNPDVVCNRAIKFGAFARWARKEGADRIATGHYARVRQQGAHFDLLRGLDPEKDQSYFLYRLDQNDLARTIFPVGDMLKSQVRAKARALKLPVAEKHDSQGLCFVGDVSMSDFLRRFIVVEEGNVLDTAGTVIGRHEGAALYTLGERHGFTIVDAAAAQKPHYIVKIDTVSNAVVVSPNRADAEYVSAAVSDVHWLHRAYPAGTEITFQARYREKPRAAKIRSNTSGLVIESAEPHLFPPGQSLVMYQGELCLGGGIVRGGIAKTVVSPNSTPKEKISTPAPVSNIRRRVQ